MPRRSIARPRTEQRKRPVNANVLSSFPAAEALSFLRETRGCSTWTARDLARSLKVSLADAEQAIAILELQGYVKRSGKNEWMTTLAGESVAGSKIPRFTPERVGKALADLRNRIEEVNRDSLAPYRITEAVAFGDFLQPRTRVQSAEVGVRLERRNSEAADSSSAQERQRQAAFLKLLRGKGGVLHVRSFENWMSVRTYRRLL